MFDSLSNIIIVLIPVAIFIGRIVLQAQAKRKPEPPKKQPHIPVHFEDYDEDRRVFAPSAVSRPELQSKDINEAYDPPLQMDSTPKPPKKAKTPAAESSQGARGILNLNHLSPMKQAVVMAEILGLPKGVQ
jgi:hypothetical protein